MASWEPERKVTVSKTHLAAVCFVSVCCLGAAALLYFGGFGG